MSYYCKQRDDYSCGAIAVLNILKIYGLDENLNYIEYLKDILGTTTEWGTGHKEVNSFLKMCGFKIKDVSDFDDSNVFLVSYPVSDDTRHYSVVNGNEIINYWSNRKECFEHTKRTYRQLHRLFRWNYGCNIWRIS